MKMSAAVSVPASSVPATISARRGARFAGPAA
eukprot:CAMPEP_0118940866 /NCGR_PEP_ID=MMETSP1169-20130426/32535_1 /TAXON_ID=36882 /ORGANISM="Pyramimonas obovata, Strain CCMP722" /LENGTH=31 /DNA_ID= /DNA_START= /DNA_END= /DNA_ORIENTATION=